MKDSHRDTMTFMKLQQVIAGKISVMCNQLQYVPFAGLGAAGSGRSTPGWGLGRSLLSAMRSRAATSTRKGGHARHRRPGTRKPNLSWRETGSKLAIAMAGYVEPGPAASAVPEIRPTSSTRQRKRAERWRTLCAKYAPAYQATPKRAASA